MRARVRWIQRHRALEQRHRAIEHFERLALSIEQSAREGLVRADDLRLGQRACGRNRRAQRAGELAHQSILHFKNCGERAIDLRRPRHLSRRHIGQRCRHAKRVTRPLKAAAHEPARLEVTRGAEEQPVVSIPCLQTKPLQDLQHALARNHGDAFQLSRVRRQRLRNPGAHPVIVGTSGDVDEAAHHDRVAGIGARRSAQSFTYPNGCEHLTQADRGAKPILAVAREHPPDETFENRQSRIPR